MAVMSSKFVRVGQIWNLLMEILLMNDFIVEMIMLSDGTWHEKKNFMNLWTILSIEGAITVQINNFWKHENFFSRKKKPCKKQSTFLQVKIQM